MACETLCERKIILSVAITIVCLRYLNVFAGIFNIKEWSIMSTAFFAVL